MSKQNDKELDSKTLEEQENLYYRKKKEELDEFEEFLRKKPDGNILCDESWSIKSVLTPSEVRKEKERVDHEVRRRSYYR